ncbi:MAG: thiamine phosphate synthase [Blastopirellula sp.]|nr:MAG: thiamine phosphate synthase [Blastopirellula sp.]
MNTEDRHFEQQQTQATALRALDAAANRASEGLRVAEDYTRFVLDDWYLTGNLKQLRHDLQQIVSQIPQTELHACRQTTTDVGTEIKTTTEYQRADWDDLVSANLKRAEQALRTLEEFSKIIGTYQPASFESLRYRVYTLHKLLTTTQQSQSRLKDAKLYVLLDGRDSGESFHALATELIEAQVDVIQLRDKKLSDKQLLSHAKLLRKLTSNTSTLFIMNDRPDIAALSDADGVHLGQDELSVKEARAIIGPKKLIGISTHSLEQVKQAITDGANYLGTGPTFASQTKNFKEFPGLKFIEQANQLSTLPMFAIGGINLENLPQVLKTGASRIAVSHAVIEAKQPKLAVQELKNKLANIERD